MVKSSHAEYLAGAFNPKYVKFITKKFGEFLKKNPCIDGIAVMGTSGLLIGPILSAKYNLPLTVVRKTTEDCHSARNIEIGNDNATNYVFVDDLVSSGNTFQNVKAELDGKRKVICGIFCYHEKRDLDECDESIALDIVYEGYNYNRWARRYSA